MLQSLLPFLGTSSFHALSVILASTAAFQSLIAVWAATSPRHWFWRALAVWCSVMLLAPIRAYQPAIVFAASSVLIVTAITANRWRRQSKQRSPSFRFGLSDIFLLTLLVGLSLAGMLYVQKRLDNFNVVNAGLVAAALIAVTLFAYAAWRSERRIAPCVLLIATIALLAFSIPRLGFNSDDYDALILLGITFNPSYRGHDAVRIAMVLGEFASLLLFALVLLHTSRRQDAASSRHRLASGFLVALALLVGLPLAAMYWQMLWLAPLPPNFDGGSTNYERLLQIAERMQSLGIASPTATAQERSTLISETAELVQPANFIPYDMAAEPLRDQFNQHTKEAQSFRNLMRTIDAEAGTAIAQGNHARACELTLINVRLGVMLQRGGSVIEYLVGVAIQQGVAQRRFIETRRDLPPEESRQIIAALEQALLEAEDVQAVARRDRAMGERCFGWAARLENIVESAGIATNLQPFLQAAERRNAATRLLQTDLALRLYQREHGELPRDLTQLVPAYLPELPLDPYSGQPLRYRNQDTDFILYSVGKDHRDDGGKFTNIPTYYRAGASGYDYDLDMHTRP